LKERKTTLEYPSCPGISGREKTMKKNKTKLEEWRKKSGKERRIPNRKRGWILVV